MKKTTPRHGDQRALQRVTPVALAAAVLCTGMPVWAQDQTVTITGIRRGIESAIATKKNADGVVEAISAEDIGKLPDTTIAESLARLPGVTTQRDRNGNATNVSIRGLGPDFNGYLLNGREQTSTGDSRGVDLSVYPAELIAGATIYKTGDATLMTAGLAGTIDNRLVDPLSFSSRVIAGNVSKTKTGVSLPVTGSGHRYSLTYIDQFADRTIGLAVGFVHSEGTSNSLANGSWGGTGPATLVGGATQTVSVPFGGGLGFESDRNTDKRDGLAAILSYKPNKNFSTQVDFYTAKIKTALKKVKANAGNFTSLTNVTLVGDVVESGTFTMAPGGLIAYSENIFDDDKITSFGWKSTLKFSDNWSGTVDFNKNKATRVEKDIEAYAGIVGADTLSFTNGGGTPQFTLGNPGAYTNPATIAIRDQSGWSGVSYPAGHPFAGQTVPQAGYSKGPTITDKMDAVRIDFRRALGDGTMFTDLQFGVNFAKRTKDRVTDEGLIISAGNGGYDRIPYPADAYVATNIGGTGLNLLTFDPQVGLWPGATLLRKYNDDILSKTWGVQEKVTTGFLKANIDTSMAGVAVTGNLGVQLVNTDQSSAGYRAQVTSAVTLDNPAGNLRSDGKKYTDILPSLNLRGDLGNGNVLRFGLGVQIARPTLTDMRNSFAASVDTNASNATFGRFVGSAGNPQLKPFKATALDLSYEKYLANRAYFAIAGFYKKLDTYITPATNTAFDFTTYANQLGLTIPPAGAIGTYTTTLNGSGGNLSGVELTASVPFSLMTKALDGFGVTASYSSTSSSVNLPNLIGLNPSQQVPTGGVKMDLPGLSKTNTKLMVYFERAGFSAFVAQNQRSKYVGSVANTTVGGYPALIYIDKQSWLSAQIGYEIQDGMFKGLGVRFEGNNMNKPTYREFRADGSLNTENKTGASYAFKLSYKYQ
ncbi:MAG: TonB-dependent receptor [Rubrivivax sp.]|nr:TonB-dependent receptor [Rubrivivax sp.]